MGDMGWRGYEKTKPQKAEIRLHYSSLQHVTRNPQWFPGSYRDFEEDEKDMSASV